MGERALAGMHQEVLGGGDHRRRAAYGHGAGTPAQIIDREHVRWRA